MIDVCEYVCLSVVWRTWDWDVQKATWGNVASVQHCFNDVRQKLRGDCSDFDDDDDDDDDDDCDDK